MARTLFKPGNMLYPLPAVMVSCQEPGEKPNIITVAWTGTVCSDPAMVYISVRPERFSHGIIERTGEFVINLINADLTSSLDFCGVKSGKEIDKFFECGLHPVPAETVSAPSIGESPVCIECQVTQVIPLGSHDMFLAKVTAVTVEESLIDEKGKFHLNQAGLIAYSHGEYFTLGECIGNFGYSVRKKPTLAPKKPGPADTARIRSVNAVLKRTKKTINKRTSKATGKRSVDTSGNKNADGSSSINGITDTIGKKVTNTAGRKASVTADKQQKKKKKDYKPATGRKTI